MKIVNRISGLLNDSAEIPAARSPAQIEASRRNGALSNGPITAEGKSRCRANALKHGLFARVVMPPTDARRHDRLYRQIRQELIEELEPRKFTQFFILDSVVADMIQLSRIRRMIEALQRPASLTPALSEKWDQAREAGRDLKIVDGLLERIDNGHHLSCPSKASTRLAGKIVTFVEQVLENHAQVEAEAAEEAELDKHLQSSTPSPAADVANAAANTGADSAGSQCDDPDSFDLEERELARIRELFACVGPAAHRLRDKEYIAAVLRGDQKSKRGDLPRLRRLLNEWSVCWKNLRHAHRETEKQVGQVFDHSELALARFPHQLMLLQRYQRSLEIAISKKIGKLAKM